MAAANPLEQIKAFFTRFTLQQKLAIACSGSLVLVLLWALVHFMSQVEYQTLYSDLDPQEAQGIVQKLTELKVPYELTTDGRTIKIASDKLAEVRIQLASQGLPESGRIGFEISTEQISDSRISRSRSTISAPSKVSSREAS